MANKNDEKQDIEINRMTQAAMLYDSYGTLLTKKQCDIIEMYFMNDLSLSEIGEELGITRQAASILIKRTEKNLLDYECKLALVEKQAKRLKKSLALVNKLKEICENTEISENINDETREKLLEVLCGVVDMTGE